MHIDMTNGRPIKCSKCGSTNAIKPVNERDVEIRCADCGHTKLTREAEQRQHEREYGSRMQQWVYDRETDPTF
jgi:predicted RNA-binding Zn-ribbon protein involved in translation (DUF1610 family)